MKKTLEKYKSLEERNLNLLRKELQELQQEMEDVEYQIKTLNENLLSFDYRNFQYISDFHLVNSYINNLRNQVQELNNKLRILYKKEENLKSEIVELNAKIKAVEKYMEKLEKEKLKEILKKEVAIIDEIFSRKFNGN